jgi:hypothetical protein
MSLTVDHPWFLVLFAFIAVHLLPTYLKGLWSAWWSKGTAEKVWEVDEGCTLVEVDWNKCLSAFDAVVLSTGAGLFQNSIIKEELPMQLVRGQSIELDLGERTFDKARLCWKYDAAPLLEHNRVLIGATSRIQGRSSGFYWGRGRAKETI